MDLSALKAELKAWEAQFRSSNNGQNPTKADIKANPAIADKYKIYNTAKSSRLSLPPAPSSSKGASSTRPSTSATNAPPDVFKTPTKPKPRSSLPAFSPSKSSAERNAAASGSGSKATYVVANSPVKLRALAAAHSASSPNSKQHPNGGTNSASLGTSDDPRAVRVVGSPKKYNPFAASNSSLEAKTAPSPRKAASSNGRRNLFGEMFASGSSMRRSASQGPTSSAPSSQSGTQGQVAQTNGGAAGASSALSAPAEKVQQGGEKKKKSWESIFSGARKGGEGNEDGMDLDEDVLGPSPVKPSAARRQFKPLIEHEDDQPTNTLSYSLSDSTSSAPGPPPPVSAARERERASGNGVHPLFAQLPRGLKRSAPAAATAAGAEKNAFYSLPLSKSKGKALVRARADEGEYPSEESEPDEAGAVKPDKKKSKAATTAATAGKGKAKSKLTLKEKAQLERGDDGFDDDGMEVGQETRRAQPAPALVVDLDDDEGQGERASNGAKQTLRIQRWGRTKSRQHLHGAEEDEDGDEFLPTGSQSSSLFYRDSLDLLSHQSAEPLASASAVDDEDDDGTTPSLLVPDSPNGKISVPSELVELLSLRSPPKKSQRHRERDRDREVDNILRDPRQTAKRKTGLMDLSDEDEREGEEDGAGGGDGESGGEDDWESEAEGWKEEDDGAMDDYGKELEL